VAGERKSERAHVCRSAARAPGDLVRWRSITAQRHAPLARALSTSGSFSFKANTRGTRDRPVWLGPVRPRGTQQNYPDARRLFLGRAVAVPDSTANPFPDFDWKRIPEGRSNPRPRERRGGVFGLAAVPGRGLRPVPGRSEGAEKNGVRRPARPAAAFRGSRACCSQPAGRAVAAISEGLVGGSEMVVGRLCQDVPGRRSRGVKLGES
jgi:hypothetical protein